MGIRATLKWIATVSFVFGAAGSATAQPAGGDPAGAQVGFERRPQLSPQEELTQADAILARIDAAAGTVRRQLEAARAARDVVRTLCLNDKLSQVDVAIRSARDRQQALQAAVRSNDVEMANHEFTILTVLNQRAVQQGAQANQCIGEEYAFVGQTQVTAEQDPNLPGENTTDFPPPADGALIPAPPIPVSAHQ